MWDSTLDFISQAASSSLFIFCFCNMIIVVILIESKQSINIGQELEIPLSTVTTMHSHDISSANGIRIVEESTTFTVTAEASKCMETKVVEDDIKFIERNCCSNDEESQQEEEKLEDDELRRRVEEFIDKVNKGWQAELLMTSGLI